MGFIPPSTRDRYESILLFWQLAYPAFGSLQWLVEWYGMGKTSTPSRLNIPGRLAWLTMEVPGFLTLLYVLRALPARLGVEDLPWQNRVLAGLFVIHYVYRAIIFPLLQPSMAPIHLLVWLSAISFQVFNGTCLGSWLAGYGPLSEESWSAQAPLPQFVLGVGVFYVGLASNFFHDELLREIRRRRPCPGNKGGDDEAKAGGTKRYEIPHGGLFRYVLYPHYLCEWIEWFGFLMAAGWTCAPAWAFLVNEVFAMLPRAIRGKAWYVDRFGREKVGRRRAIIPGLL
ncbi:hypothetical protein L249_3099 [Ophiocordyceps polyrhachis-furcata BCC 54312]|uniref:3-oxo-5-alpha-steroid 4-dehydrogenase C-terminal domain-containing protein n=1 Tax=Ophiocordyceps polyrhachis-furcata BCC 54312 TaxID=1330021 RepID=A0A367LS21_9HYPO|nr:hypothetical protein L249_3099 [Ophiocordyceps polyrhachis-furcata BCC 54312]